MLKDNHGRTINYLRLAVTDRCNLRCQYCMPAQGIDFVPSEGLLSMDDLKKLGALMVGMGIDKIRITGGEPFVRKDLMELLRHLAGLRGLRNISVTTNASLIGPHIDELKALGITDINVSLDSIDRETFERITRRKQFDTVHENLMRLISEGFRVRINFIVLEGQNEQDIIPTLEAMKRHPVSVRFLEEMPFNGGTKNFNTIKWHHKAILDHITAAYPGYRKLDSPKTSTSVNYKIDGHAGTFGIIPSFSRTFCGSCNRLRITATGDVITCLYGRPVANLREPLRLGWHQGELASIILGAIGKRARTGFEAQAAHAGTVFESSMTSLGG